MKKYLIASLLVLVSMFSYASNNGKYYVDIDNESGKTVVLKVLLNGTTLHASATVPSGSTLGTGISSQVNGFVIEAYDTNGRYITSYSPILSKPVIQSNLYFRLGRDNRISEYDRNSGGNPGGGGGGGNPGDHFIPMQ